MTSVNDSRGSIWRRWDPHIHTPGTVLNNEFGPDDWDAFLTLIEQSEPRIQALGVTDYCSLDRYEEVLSHVAHGRLADVPLIFPNVELRLPIEARSPVNIHLLISPEDPNHVDLGRRFLRELKFDYRGETYACDQADLRSLGRKHDPNATDDMAALKVGTNQFKVTPEALKAAFKASDWARDNVTVAVAGGSTDGTSGLQSDAGMAATRVEIERMSSIIFSSTPAQRKFWLGQGVETEEQLNEKWDGKKVCLHGSDAHELDKVGKPDKDRYTWIKGDPTFESLRQACIEPEERVLVGEAPPDGALDHRTIRAVSAEGAEWLSEPTVPLNRGLVAIIGARGSGKTALADLIAAASHAATSDRTTSQSFLVRAKGHLGDLTVGLEWADDSDDEVTLPLSEQSDVQPRVQYLSQQFVEQLCSSEGITDELLAEIERVIFEAHPYESRLGASTFRSLLDLKAGPGRLKRQRAHEDMETIARKIEAEREAIASMTGLKAKLERHQAAAKADKDARERLLRRGNAGNAHRLGEINNALAGARSEAETLNNQLQALEALTADVEDLEVRRLPSFKSSLEENHSAAGLTEDEWGEFNLTFTGKPKEVLSSRVDSVKKKIETLNGPEIPPPAEPIGIVQPFIPDDADLTKVTLGALKAETWRLQQLIGLDEARTKQLNELNTKINKTDSEIENVERQVKEAEGGTDRIALLSGQRKDAYASLFDGFADEQTQLAELYAPLGRLLDEEEGALGKLTFTVRRTVDAESWAQQGENLLDLRKKGPFRGHGELHKVVREELLEAWSTGDSADVATAMAGFRDSHDREILDHAPVARHNPDAFREWARNISAWLGSTDHITVQYGIRYDGVDIEQLSPGTRGIVLLLLYLSVDYLDDRPLVIDQPEENLDPKSIFDELVDRFRSARKNRQIIIVTHNANLVVNTDADQVIVATAGPHRPGHLPEITYTSGGLENPEIREQVCEILEGGKTAFEERARRLRFSSW